MGYDGLLLDHDGVIVTLGDRESLTTATEAALADAGLDPTPDLVETLHVSADREDVRSIGDRLGLDPATLWRHRDDRVAETLRAEARAGRKAPYDDAEVLRSIECPVGVVSNNQTRVVEFVLAHYDLRDAVEVVRAREPTVESLARKKPAPTFLEEAVAALEVTNPLYVGDSESDVVAGRRAGLDVAFLRRPHRDGLDLAVEPTHEVGDLHAVRDLVAAGRASGRPG